MERDVLGRLEDGVSRLRREDGLSDAKRLLLEVFESWQSVVDSALNRDEEVKRAARRWNSIELDQALDEAESETDELGTYEIVKKLAELLAAFIGSVILYLHEEDLYSPWPRDVEYSLKAAGVLRSSAVRLAAAEESKRSAVMSAAEAEASADKAKQAAGSAGSASLAAFFQSYARGENAASWAFRAMAFGGLVATVVLSWQFFLESERQALSIPSLVLRIAIIAALAGISTYAVRIAGQHRVLGNWAKTISVQLLSFDAFMEPIESKIVRDAIYEQFAQRVLGPPPEARASGEPKVSLSAQDLMSLIPKSSSPN